MTLTILLIGLTCLISIPAFRNGEMKYRLLHYPYLETHNGEWYRILTSGFIHADWVHLFINMFVLYQFGGIVESIYVDQLFGPMWGRVLFLVMYLTPPWALQEPFQVFCMLTFYLRHGRCLDCSVSFLFRLLFLGCCISFILLMLPSTAAITSGTMPTFTALCSGFSLPWL